MQDLTNLLPKIKPQSWSKKLPSKSTPCLLSLWMLCRDMPLEHQMVVGEISSVLANRFSGSGGTEESAARTSMRKFTPGYWRGEVSR